MSPPHLIAVAGLVWLIVNGLWLAISVRRARKLITRLAERHPEFCVSAGKLPRGYANHPGRIRCFAMLMRREYEDPDDPYLVSGLDRQRGLENGQMCFLTIGFADLAAAVVWLELIRPG